MLLFFIEIKPFCHDQIKIFIDFETQEWDNKGNLHVI